MVWSRDIIRVRSPASETCLIRRQSCVPTREECLHLAKLSCRAADFAISAGLKARAVTGPRCGDVVSPLTDFNAAEVPRHNVDSARSAPVPDALARHWWRLENW